MRPMTPERTLEAPVRTLRPRYGEHLENGMKLWRFELYLPWGEGVLVEDVRTGEAVHWTMSEFSRAAANGLRILGRGD